MKAHNDINRKTCCNCFFSNTCNNKTKDKCDYSKYQNKSEICIECINFASFARACDKYRQRRLGGQVLINGLGHQTIA